eukprot:319556-Karenia_brevis.AAC.1
MLKNLCVEIVVTDVPFVKKLNLKLIFLSQCGTTGSPRISEVSFATAADHDAHLITAKLVVYAGTKIA